MENTQQIVPNHLKYGILYDFLGMTGNKEIAFSNIVDPRFS